MDVYDNAPLWWLLCQAPQDPEKIRHLRAAIAARQREEGDGGQPYGLHGAVDPVLKQIGEDIERRQAEDLGHFHYVQTDRVDPETREAAESMLRFCEPPWPVEIKWFVPEGEAEREYVRRWRRRDWPGFRETSPVLGVARGKGDHVWISADLDCGGAMRLVAHETRHLVQPAGMTPEEREKDAESYAGVQVLRLRGW